MRYDHLIAEDINRHMLKVSDMMLIEIKGVKELSTAEFQLPRDLANYLITIEDHLGKMKKLQRDYDDLLTALKTKE
jgi:hypothetical protein